MFKGPKRSERLKYFVCGVNAAGKTAVLQELIVRRPDVFHIRGSKAFMRYLGLGEDYEALRKYPHEDALRKLKQMVEGIVSVYSHDTILFDAHVLNMVRGEVKEVTGDWLRLFDAFVLVEAPPEVILVRLAWGERDRALFPDEDLDKQIELLTKYTVAYKDRFCELAAQYGKPMICLDNGGETVEPAVKFLLESMDRIQKGALD